MTITFRVGCVRAMLTLAMVLASMLVARSSYAQISAQWFGTWRVDLARSSYPGAPPFKKMTCRIESMPDARVRVVYDIIRPRGGLTHLEWTGSIDGRDYSLQGVEDVVTNAYRRLDDRTWEIIQKIDGMVSLTATMTVSEDGRTLTTTSPGSVAVFVRQ